MATEPAARSRPLPAELVAVLDEPGGGEVAILVRGPGSLVVDQVRQACPDRSVQVFQATTDKSALHAQLSAHGRYRALVVDLDNVPTRASMFRDVFLHLEPDGMLWFPTLREAGDDPDRRPRDRQLMPYLTKLIGARGLRAEGVDWRRRDEIAMSEAVGRLVIDEDSTLVTNRIASFAKMREHEMNAVLALRPDLGTVLEVRPALEFGSRATIRHNYIPYERHHEVFSVPPMSLRAYTDARCRSGGVAVSANLILPETFRHNQQARLRQLRAPNRSHYFADLTPRPPSGRLSGSYLYLDSEYPGHFGHFLSEVVSRLWGWGPAKSRYPDLKALISLPAGRAEPPSYIREIFAAAGIRPEDLVAFPADDSVIVERLIGVTPMFSMPDYVHPDIADVWSTLREHLPRTGGTSQPDRIFVRRPDESIRTCHNEAAVVARFEAAGFVAVRPETMPLGDQAAMFAEATVIAGFAGSAMLNLLYCPTPKRVILVGPESYTSNNEYLIASVLGHEIDQIGSRPDLAHPPGQWSVDAFYSNYSFDFDREGLLLDEVLAGLPRRRLTDRWKARAARPRLASKLPRRPTS